MNLLWGRSGSRELLGQSAVRLAENQENEGGSRRSRRSVSTGEGH